VTIAVADNGIGIAREDIPKALAATASRNVDAQP
jgi:DNA mismatch repair ATPase MutL